MCPTMFRALDLLLIYTFNISDLGLTFHLALNPIFFYHLFDFLSSYIDLLISHDDNSLKQLLGVSVAVWSGLTIYGMLPC